MLIYLVTLIFEILFLFFLSREVQRKMGRFLYKITRNKKAAVYAMSVLFLPGTFIHEASHFIAALFLLVPVGNMQLVPKIKEETIELGSVSIAKTDFIRSFLISTAPLFVGIVLIFTTIYFSISNGWYGNFWITLLITYLIFTVSNTMFISKKDAQGVVGFLIFVIIIVIVMLLLGLNIDISLSDNSEIVKIISKSCLFFALPVLLDTFILFVFN